MRQLYGRGHEVIELPTHREAVAPAGFSRLS